MPESLAFVEVDRSMDLPGSGPCFDHHVQFYETEAFIHRVVADYVATGLHRGQSLVLVVTAQHRERISKLLASSALDAGASNIHWLDARRLLSTFMDGTVPNAKNFTSYMGRALEEIRNGHEHAPVRVYGELADILAHSGNLKAAVSVEQLWNELGATWNFSLLCCYTKGNFHCGAQREHFHRICNEHARVRFNHGTPFEFEDEVREKSA